MPSGKKAKQQRRAAATSGSGGRKPPPPRSTGGGREPFNFSRRTLVVWLGDPRDIRLGSHAQIQLEVGRPLVSPVQITGWGGL